MRIAVLGHKRIPSREGGIEVVVEALAERMVTAGHDVTCYNRRGRHIAGEGHEEADSKLREYRGIKIRWVPTIDRRGLAAFSSAVSASIRAAFGRYDVVHYHAEGPAIMCWLPKLMGKTVVVTVHGLDYKCPKWGKIAKFVILCGEKNAVRFADAVTVLSRGQQHYFLENYGRKTKLVRNGITPICGREADEISRKYGLKKDSYILYLGRLVPGKGLEDLIDAYKRLKTDRKLVIAGSGSDSDDFVVRIHEMAAEDKRILFTGFVEGHFLEELYSNAYLFVMPSHLEGMPLCLLEAMSCGCCCVTSDILECTDIVGDAGYSFPVGNSTALAALLDELNRDKKKVMEKRKMAMERAGSFTWEAAVKDMLGLFEHLLRKKKSRNRRGRDKG